MLWLKTIGQGHSKPGKHWSWNHVKISLAYSLAEDEEVGEEGGDDIPNFIFFFGLS